MVHQRDAATLFAIRLYHELHRKIRCAVLFQVYGRGSRHRAIHREVDRQAFHFLVALVDDTHHQVVGQAGLHDGRRQPHRVDVKVGGELGQHRDDNHLQRRVGLGRRQVERIFLKVGIDEQGGSLKSMLMAEHLKAVDDLTHRHGRAVGVHAVELVEHLLLVHRVLILHLEAVGHQQVTARRAELVYQVAG